MAKAKPQPSVRRWLHFGGEVNELPPDYEVGWRYVFCAGFDDQCESCGARRRHLSPVKQLPADDYFVCKRCGSTKSKRLFHHFENISPCGCKPGPQCLAYNAPAFEVAMAGGRGGLKTETGFALSVRGNSGNYEKAIAAGKIPDPVDVSYIASPNYRFLVLRKNAKDMKDCWSRAKRFYAMLPYAVEFNDSDMIVRFATGAEGVFDHLATEDAFEKYQGQEFQFIWVEELTQIPDEARYQKVTLSCRSSVPSLKQKLFVTFNPGGPGHAWCRARFIDVAPERTLHTNELGLTQIFIHSTIFDNPYFLRDQAIYVKQLASIKDEGLRKKWFLGDFDAMDGLFFTEFRDKKKTHEPDTALHVIPQGAVELLPHWKRWISMDWGFSHNAAVYWHCKAADQRTYTYRESVASRIGTRAWGMRIAQASLPDLMALPDHHLMLYLSPDAFARRDDPGSPADQIAAGFAEVLGRDSVFLVNFTDEEKQLPTTDAWESLKRRQHTQQLRTNITIQRATDDRVAGWAGMREMLRWWPLMSEQDSALDPVVVNDLLVNKGVTAYLEYKRAKEAMRDEVLPKWRIFGPIRTESGQVVPNTGCPALIKCLQALQHEPGKEDVMKAEGDDPGDSARYGLHNVNDTQNAIPRELSIVNAVAALPAGSSDHSRYMTAVAAEQQYGQQAAGQSFMLPRRTGRHRRVGAMVQ